MRIGAGLWMSLLLAVPAQGRAFTGETMCVAPMPHVAAIESFDSDVCAPGRPHLLRMSMELCAPVSGHVSGDEAYLAADRALKRARELQEQSRFDDALLHYRVVEAALPRIRDHVAIMRAQLHLQAGDPARAAKAYRDAMDSVNQDLVAHAHLRLVRSLLAAGDMNAERELTDLLVRYPHIPEGPLLKLELGRFREGRGALRTAAATYRILDLTLPGYPVAAEARARLAALNARGVKVAPYSLNERFARAERLVRSGPVELARTVLAELGAEKLTNTKRRVLEGLSASLTRVDAAATVAPVMKANDDERAAREREARHKRVRALISKKARIEKQPAFKLLAILNEARQERMTDVADVIVLELARRGDAIAADARFDALSLSAGSASDSALIALADTLVSHRTMGAAARYHRGRALERAGRIEEAKADFLLVNVEDGSFTRFYANWSEQRLRALAGETSGERCTQGAPLAACTKPRHDEALTALEADLTFDVAGAAAILTPIAEEHGPAYPWLARALDLTRIGEITAATDELHEAYLAFRSAARGNALRAGLEAVYRGASAMRPSPDAATRRARLSLDLTTRESLARVAGALGDHGTAAFFGGARWAERHPHAYPREVAQAARKYHVDPDLLFAVMRVESVYQRRIVSHAGAVGLMQIMPRTGRLIADQLGEYERTTTDLLDPQINVEYAAWYLHTLLERMEGHLPLAIASYNGGPHNVRKWIRSAGDQMPLDAFLERIPFTETKRYVRRVLGYYVQYKALRGEKIEIMAVSLPQERSSTVRF